MDIAPRLSGYSGVEIIVDENTVIFSGNRTGRVLSIENENGTQEMANGILARISGFQYQPYTATDAFLDPAAEINDGIILNNVFSGIYKVSRTYAPLMTANLEAPHEEEIDHEYPYESSKERKVKRELADARAQIKVTSNAITAEVLRATTAEEELQASITATAEEISANVVKKVDGDTSSFGWSLTNSAWSVSSNNQEVFRIDSSGATVKGTIRATSGEIGGFTIGQSSIYSGMTSFGDTTHNGVYIGTRPQQPTTTPTTTTTVQTTTTDVPNVAGTVWGDSNGDGQVDMSDVVLIMQSLANPNKYGVTGTDKNHITSEGLSNASVVNNNGSVTNNDAVKIQLFLLGKAAAESDK